MRLKLKIDSRSCPKAEAPAVHMQRSKTEAGRHGLPQGSPAPDTRGPQQARRDEPGSAHTVKKKSVGSTKDT